MCGVQKQWERWLDAFVLYGTDPGTDVWGWRCVRVRKVGVEVEVGNDDDR